MAQAATYYVATNGSDSNPGTQAQPGPQPGGGRAQLLVLLGPGGAAGVHGGEFSEPLAFQTVHQPPQDQDPLGPDRVSQPVQVLGGQPVHGHRQRRQPVRCFE